MDNAKIVKIINNWTIEEREHKGNKWYVISCAVNDKEYWNKAYTLEGAIEFALQN